MKILINYAAGKYIKSQKTNTSSGKWCGFDKACQLGPEHIGKKFADKYREILSQKKGAGYWLWKPYLILRVLKTAEPGDIVMYSDSGATFLRDVNPLLSLADAQPIVLFDQPKFLNVQWTKKDTFQMMKCTGDEYLHGKHWNGAFQIYRVCRESIDFVREYLGWCANKYTLTDIPSIMGPEHELYQAHRHDQSVLSLLAIKYGIKPNVDPSQYGDLNDPYIDHHRTQE